jgi:transcriptional regulator PpsR
MQNLGTSAADQLFEAPQLFFAELNADVVAAVVAAATDLALVLDSQGVIRDISLGTSHTKELGELRQWVGRRWVETVTIENRGKVASMLAAAAAAAGTDPANQGQRPERQVNHALMGGVDLPVSYSIVPMGVQGRVLALGRDLREVAVVQQRLVDAQQSMERDYLRLRHTEARYRLLFEAVDEAVLVLDASSLIVFEHNAAAARLLGDSSQAEAYARFSQARSAGRSEALTVRLAPGGGSSNAELKLSASVFKQDSTTSLLVRLAPLSGAGDSPALGRAAEAPSLMHVVNAMPDAFVLTDMQGRILSANQAFNDMLQLAPGESVQGQSLDRWLGRPRLTSMCSSATCASTGCCACFQPPCAAVMASPVRSRSRRWPCPTARRPAWAFPSATWRGACPPRAVQTASCPARPSS